MERTEWKRVALRLLVDTAKIAAAAAAKAAIERVILPSVTKWLQDKDEPAEVGWDEDGEEEE